MVDTIENREYRDAVAGFSGVISALSKHEDEISTDELCEMWNEQIEDKGIESDLPIIEE